MFVSMCMEDVLWCIIIYNFILFFMIKMLQRVSKFWNLFSLFFSSFVKWMPWIHANHVCMLHGLIRGQMTNMKAKGYQHVPKSSGLFNGFPPPLFIPNNDFVNFYSLAWFDPISISPHYLLSFAPIMNCMWELLYEWINHYSSFFFSKKNKNCVHYSFIQSCYFNGKHFKKEN